MDHKAPSDSTVASSSMNVHKSDKDEDSVSGLSITEAKAIIKAGLQKVLRTLTITFS